MFHFRICIFLPYQPDSLRKQSDDANAHLADNNHQIELLTEQIRLMNQRHFGRKAEAILFEEEPAEKLPDSYKEHPAALFRNSIATASLVASIINGRYVNAPPPERQSKTYKCNGINLSTNTMANRVIKSTDYYLSLIYDRMHELIYDCKVIHADETPVKTMRIDNAPTD